MSPAEGRETDQGKVFRQLAADALAASFSESQVSTHITPPNKKKLHKALVCAVCRGLVHVDSIKRLSCPPKYGLKIYFKSNLVDVQLIIMIPFF